MNELISKIELSEQKSLLEEAKTTKGDLPHLLEEKIRQEIIALLMYRFRPLVQKRLFHDIVL